VKKGKHCRNAWCIHEGKKYHVRIIASALPPEKAAEARRKREQEAKKKGKQLQPDTLFEVRMDIADYKPAKASLVL